MLVAFHSNIECLHESVMITWHNAGSQESIVLKNYRSAWWFALKFSRHTATWYEKESVQLQILSPTSWSLCQPTYTRTHRHCHIHIQVIHIVHTYTHVAYIHICTWIHTHINNTIMQIFRSQFYVHRSVNLLLSSKRRTLKHKNKVHTYCRHRVSSGRGCLHQYKQQNQETGGKAHRWNRKQYVCLSK